MKKISSIFTYFNKKIFPALWFGFLGVFVLISLPPMISKGEVDIMFIVAPIVLAVFGYFIMKALVFDLVDEAWDDGDSLVFKNKGKEERISLSNILNINYVVVSNPPRVTLTLREPCGFGKEVTFSPQFGVIPFKKSPLITDLIERVDNARKS